MADRVQFDIDTRSFTQAMRRFAERSELGGERVLRMTALSVQTDVTDHWPRDTGQSAGKWQVRRLSREEYELRNRAPYAVTIEFGGYPGVGPKTVRLGPQRLAEGIVTNAGIYPKQKPAAPLRRALARHQRMFEGETADMLQREWRRL